MAENISQKITDKAFCNAYYVPNIKSPLIKKIFKPIKEPFKDLRFKNCCILIVSL